MIPKINVYLNVMIISILNNYNIYSIEKYSAVDGVDVKSHIQRVLSKLFTNKFAAECSWTGRTFAKHVAKFKIHD